jgi:hypothetical protein
MIANDNSNIVLIVKIIILIKLKKSIKLSIFLGKKKGWLQQDLFNYIFYTKSIKID